MRISARTKAALAAGPRSTGLGRPIALTAWREGEEAKSGYGNAAAALTMRGIGTPRM